MKAIDVYKGSNGAVTKAYYAELEKRGPAGLIAMNLFRAQKCSERAKVYRGGIPGKGRYRDMAYERKSWSMQNLVKALGEHGADLGIRWGWGLDGQESGFAPWVLYIDLPQGQVSFHSTARFEGPEYAGKWDGATGASPLRIVCFCDAVMETMGAMA